MFDVTPPDRPQSPPQDAIDTPIPRCGSSAAFTAPLLTALALALGCFSIALNSLFSASAPSPAAAEITAALALLLLTLYIWGILPKSRGFIVFLLAAAAMLTFFVRAIVPDRLFVIAALPLTLIFVIGIGGMLLAMADRRALLLALLIPVAGYGLSLLLTGSFFGSCAVLLPLPATVVLAIGTRRSAAGGNGPGRVGVICVTSVALCLSFAAAAALILYEANGSLSLAALTEALDGLRADMTAFILSAAAETEVTEELFSPEVAENMVNALINLLPGYLIAASNIFAAIAQNLQLAGLETNALGGSLAPRVRLFRMSFISCILFFLCYIIMIISGAEASTLTGTVAQNLYLVLLPGLGLSGLIRVSRFLARKLRSGIGCLTPLLFMMLPMLVFAVPFLFGIIEAAGQAAELIRTRLRTENNE